jgi:hypothetical protein
MAPRDSVTRVARRIRAWPATEPLATAGCFQSARPLPTQNSLIEQASFSTRVQTSRLIARSAPAARALKTCARLFTER